MGISCSMRYHVVALPGTSVCMQINVIFSKERMCFVSMDMSLERQLGGGLMLAGLLTKCSPVRTSKHRSMS